MTKTLPEEIKQKMLARIPLQRMGQPADIAAAVRFLVSDAAAYITGQVLGVNGGECICNGRWYTEGFATRSGRVAQLAEQLTLNQ